MQNRTTFYSLLFTLLLLGFSCAKAPVKKVRKTKKSYDQGVEDEFSKIENDQRDVLEYYRRLRSQNWDNYKRKYNRNDKKKYKKNTSPRAKVYRPQDYNTPPKVSAPEPKRKALPQRRSLPQGQIEEMKIEVRQHMDYFCMQMRKSKRFSDTADCLAFTEDIYNTCMAKYPVLYDRSPVKCIRGKLH
jgi:hypothetical protein